MSENQKRQPKGIPVGGQFAANAHDEATQSLIGADLSQRGRALVFGKHVKAVATEQKAGGDRANQWWDQQFSIAEYEGANSENSYPKMPDDNTPSALSGNAISGKSMSGKLRTYRRRYQGEGKIEVQMPSATAVKRYSESIDDGTFDIPVSVTRPNGTTVDGWVRVTRNGKNQWSTTALGFGEGDELPVSESVSAVLESQSPRSSLKGIQDFAARRAQRQSVEGIPFENIERSSFITGLSYVPGSSVAAVRIGKRTYGYRGVSPETYLQLRSAPNLGSAYNSMLKQNPNVSQSFSIPSCDKCGNMYPPGSEHRCPERHVKSSIGLGQDFNQAARLRAAATRGRK